jgi:hypothetical protein
VSLSCTIGRSGALELADECITSDQIAAREKREREVEAAFAALQDEIPVYPPAGGRSLRRCAWKTSASPRYGFSSRFAITSTLPMVIPVRLTPRTAPPWPTSSVSCRDTVVPLSQGLHDLGRNPDRHSKFVLTLRDLPQ